MPKSAAASEIAFPASSLDRSVRVVALYEGIKGVLVLAVTSGLTLLHKDLHDLAMRAVQHAHLDPAAKYPHLFLDAAAHLQDMRLALLAAGAIAYVAIHFAEAYGLWYGLAWAEVLAAVSAAIYLPFELYELVQKATAVRATLLAVNTAVVFLMLLALRRRRPEGVLSKA
jgi:uncharacterized membrane protein (DUF2068 family)